MDATDAGTIYPFADEHLDAAADLYVAVFNAPPWDDAWTREAARRRLGDALATPGSLGLALLGDGLLGFALGHREPWYDGEHYYLKELCVRADRRRRGLGARLLRHLEGELRRLGSGRSTCSPPARVPPPRSTPSRGTTRARGWR